MNELIQAVMNLKVLSMKHITEYPATYHAVDVVSQIIGWEEAARLGKAELRCKPLRRPKMPKTQSQKENERIKAAKKAARTGSKKDLQVYLKLRRER